MRTTPLFRLSLLLCAAAASSCAYWTEPPGSAAKPAGAASPKQAGAGATTPASAAGTGTATTSTPAQGRVVKLIGSSTIGTSLAPKLAAAFLTQAGAPDAKIDTSAKGDNRISVTGHLDSGLVTFVVDYPGSGAAFDCLRAKTCDVGLSSRPIKPEEAAQLGALGDMTSPAAEHVVAMDGVAVVVHRANRVQKLSIPQIAGIFRGTITNWSAVDGAPGEIHPFIRDTKSGTYETFIQFVTHGADLPTDKAKVMDDSESLASGVGRDEGGIGFVGLAFVGGTKAVAVQDGDSAPLAPTAFSVGTEDYAFSRRLYFYTPEQPTQPLAGRFVDFALSEAGQKVVAETGFVSLNVSTETPTIPSGAPTGYLRAVNGARRLSFNFRFRSGTSALDGKALSDLDRMTRYLRATVSTPSVALLGFADNMGGAATNLDLSRQRAKAVAGQLKTRGIDVQVVDGFGSALPIAPNETADGRNRNRRVEVWVK